MFGFITILFLLILHIFSLLHCFTFLHLYIKLFLFLNSIYPSTILVVTIKKLTSIKSMLLNIFYFFGIIKLFYQITISLILLDAIPCLILSFLSPHVKIFLLFHTDWVFRIIHMLTTSVPHIFLASTTSLLWLFSIMQKWHQKTF